MLPITLTKTGNHLYLQTGLLFRYAWDSVDAFTFM